LALGFLARELEKLNAAASPLRHGEHPVPPFHWEIEFPEVFVRKDGGFDAIVGNPPFAGKNTIIGGNAKSYLPWLQSLHEGAHGNADIVAHFFRRAFGLLRPGGVSNRREHPPMPPACLDDEFVALPVGKGDAFMMRAPFGQYSSKARGTSEPAYKQTGERAIRSRPPQGDEIGSARPRADEVNGHGSLFTILFSRLLCHGSQLPAMAQLAPHCSYA
jgi:hypothetical protein